MIASGGERSTACSMLWSGSSAPQALPAVGPIAVDGLDESAYSFYRHHDLQPIEGSPRLVMKVATARSMLEA